MRYLSDAVTVTAPASSANLGPGFDALGLALALADRVDARVTASGLEVEVRGAGAPLVPRDEAHLVVRAMRAAFDLMGGQPPGLHVWCVNSIPHGRGLGSSAAAVVAGVLSARALVGDPANRLGDPAVLALAAELEGHPDNAAACLLGGLTVAWWGRCGAEAVRMDVRLNAAVFVPPSSMATSTARNLLPPAVSHAAAARNAGRAALLVAALTAQPLVPATLLAATQDELHQPYRAEAMPGSMALVQRLRDAGVPAMLSGAGPAVLALVVPERPPHSEEVDRWTGRRWGVPEWDVQLLDVDRIGARVEPDAE